jgi:hypothetical protein
VAFVAYHFHWDLERVLGLEHAERARWVAEISRLNERANEEAARGGRVSVASVGSPDAVG